MATITVDTYLDDGTARAAGEAWTCNGGKLTIRTDTRWHAGSPASMTGSLGAQTVSATLGGGILIDGRNVRWLPYNTGTGNVPSIGTSITQGGVSGYLLGVWDTLTSAPSAAGGAMPADGFIKLREVTGGAYTAGALSGIGASATGADVTGWIEVVQDQSTAITVSRKGTGHQVRGDWFYLDNTSGSVGQVLQIPTNGGGANTYCPGVWIETAPGSDEYEYWPALTAASANGWLHTHLGGPAGGTDRRQRFVKDLGSGQLQIGQSYSVSGTYLAWTQSGTYNWANNILTVTITGHALNAGETLYFDFTSGSGVDGTYTIETVTGANNFTVAMPGAGTSGNVSVSRLRCSLTAHGMSLGNKVALDFTSGAGVDGTYTILHTAVTDYFYVDTGIGTSDTGNVTMNVTIGDVPPAGCKVRIPNVIMRQCTTAARATNARPHATHTSRPTFTTTGAGTIDHEYAYSDWYYNFSQPYSIRLRHVAAGYDAMAISECATAIDMLDGGVSMNQALDLVTFTLTSCFAGGTIEGWKFFRGNTPGTNDHAVTLSLCAGQTFINCEAGIIQFARSSGVSWNVSLCRNLTFTDCRGINGGAFTMTTCANIEVNDYDHVDRFIGRTNVTSATYAFAIITKCADIAIKGVTCGYSNTVSDVHPYAGFFNVTSCDRITMRNVGTRTTPLSSATVNTAQPASIYVSGGNNSSIKLQRCYLNSIRTSLITDTNTDKNVIYESVSARSLSTNLAYTLTVAALNATVKGCYAPTLTTAANASVYGTHIWDCFTYWFRRASTYTWSGNVVTVSFTAHGYVVGDKVYLDFTSGGATASGVYTVRSSAANSFTVDLAGSGTAGNCISWRHLTSTPTDLLTTQGRLHFPMNEATTETSSYVTLAGSAQFTSTPSLSLPAANDEAVIESPYTIIGHSAFPNIPAIITGAPVSQASTYTWSAGVVTVTFTAHGLIAGDQVFLDASSGTLPDGLYTIATVPTANTYTISLVGSGTSGNCTAFRLVRVEYKIDTGTGYNASWRNLVLYKVGCAVTSGSATVTMVSTAGIAAGDYVYAPGVKPDVTVQSIDSATQITLSQTADVTNSNQQLIFNRLPTETISASTGFGLKIRITADTPGKTMGLTYITIPTSTTAASQDNLYPLDTVEANLQLYGLSTGSEIHVYRTSDGLELAGTEGTIGSTFDYAYTWTGSDVNVFITVIKVGYQWIRYDNQILGSAGLTIPVFQSIDRNYKNP